VYDFLAALGVRWPRPGEEELPHSGAAAPAEYPLREPSAYQPSEKNPAKWRRLVISRETPLKNREPALTWAIRNRVDALVLPLEEAASPGFQAALSALTGTQRQSRQRLLRLADQYALTLEAGGWDLSLLVPRWNFPFSRDVFRMEMGKRMKQYNFCPTNPDTIAILTQEAEKVFQGNPGIKVFHLWPDRKQEQTWCSCPTCRAFTRQEQNRIAVNTAADVLAKLDGEGRISYYESEDEEADIAVRENMFRLRHLPGKSGAEEEGLFFAEEPEAGPPADC
jgi:hypothetical protein